MKVENIYPLPPARRVRRAAVLRVLRWPLLAAGIGCAAVNLCVGRPWWSVIVCWSLWSLWSLIFAIDLVEYNRISQTIRAIRDTVVLLLLINLLLTPGYDWALRVAAPLVTFAGLVAAATLFFTDVTRQSQNLLPLFSLLLLALVYAAAGLSVWRSGSWSCLLLGVTALGVLAACIAILRGSVLRELGRRLHTR